MAAIAALKKSAVALADSLAAENLNILGVPKTMPLYHLAIDFSAGTVRLMNFHEMDPFYRQLQRSYATPEFFLISTPLLATNHSLAKALRGKYFDALLDHLAASLEGRDVDIEKVKAAFASKVKCYHGAADETQIAEQLMARYEAGEISADTTDAELLRMIREHMKSLKAQKIWIYPRFVEASRVLEELKAKIADVEAEKRRWRRAA